MSATEVRMIPKHAQIEHGLALAKGSQANPIDPIDHDLDAEVKPKSTNNGFPERALEKVDSEESAEIELEAITVNLNSGIAPSETVVARDTGFDASPTANGKWR